MPPFQVHLLRRFSAALLGSVRAADLGTKWKAEFDSQVGWKKYGFDLKADGG